MRVEEEEQEGKVTSRGGIGEREGKTSEGENPRVKSA